MKPITFTPDLSGNYYPITTADYNAIKDAIILITDWPGGVAARLDLGTASVNLYSVSQEKQKLQSQRDDIDSQIATLDAIQPNVPSSAQQQ